MAALHTVVFAVAVASSALLLAIYLLSYLRPDRRIWPPGSRDWRFYLHWGADGLSFAGAFALAYLDWGTLAVPGPVRLAGGLLLLAGAAVTAVVELGLGSDESLGMMGDLRTDGPYRYSRNPQYVGLFLATLGFVLVAAAATVTVVGVLRLLTWLVLPLPEEPWLRSTYGEAYERYRESVPRFVGRTTFDRLRADLASGDTRSENG